MNRENLKKGNELNEEIISLKNKIQTLISLGSEDNSVTLKGGRIGGKIIPYIKGFPASVLADCVKPALDYYEKELAELEKQFEQL